MEEGRNQYSSPVPISALLETEKGKTRDELAKLAGVGHDTITKNGYIKHMMLSYNHFVTNGHMKISH